MPQVSIFAGERHGHPKRRRVAANPTFRPPFINGGGSGAREIRRDPKWVRLAADDENINVVGRTAGSDRRVLGQLGPRRKRFDPLLGQSCRKARLHLACVDPLVAKSLRSKGLKRDACKWIVENSTVPAAHFPRYQQAAGESAGVSA
jgi:hypothetical protein